MLLLADSGGTKAQWRVLDAGEVVCEVTTSGIHPTFQDSETMKQLLVTALLPELTKISKSIEKVAFYCAGYSSPERMKRVDDALASVFPEATIFAYHDLLGAAHATCGKESGMAAILGTGSSSCLYNGKEIIHHVPSLAFALGDEGSGAAIGKEWLRAYFYGEVPKDLATSFYTEFQPDKDEVIRRVYQVPMPNAFLASFCPFLSANLDHSFVSHLVTECMDEFIKRQIMKYEGHQVLPLHCVGSVAWYFRDVLKIAAENHGIHLGKVLQNPMDGLVDYWKDDELRVKSEE